MGKIIAFTNQKGGVGKTTTCVNLSAFLVEMGKRVLIIDVDPQGNATSGIGVDKDKETKTIYDVLCEQCDISEAVTLSPIKGLEIIPATVDLAGAEVELVRMPGRERLLKKYLEKVRNSYDFVCIDCPPSLGLLTLNALTSADALVIPIQCEFFALEGVSQLINTVRLIRKQGLNPDLDIDGVLLTMYDKRSSLTDQVSNEILKFFGKKVFKTKVPRNIRLAEAPSHGLPITKYDPKCAGAIAYGQLAKEFLARQPK
ncbi:MAG: AAA family ATPase [Firmicutes bacterium]|nr:AAA family ATPase [Bacillota bacterium]